MDSCTSDVVVLEFRLRRGVVSRLVRVGGRSLRVVTVVVVAVLFMAGFVTSCIRRGLWLLSCSGVRSELHRSVGLAARREALSSVRRGVVGGIAEFRRGATSPPEAAAFSFPYAGLGTFHVRSRQCCGGSAIRTDRATGSG